MTVIASKVERNAPVPGKHCFFKDGHPASNIVESCLGSSEALVSERFVMVWMINGGGRPFIAEV